MLFLLMIVVCVLALVGIILLLCRAYRVALRWCVATLAITLLCLFAGLGYLNHNYGWLSRLQQEVEQNHPSVNKLELNQKYPFFGITCDTKTADKADAEGAFQEIKTYLLSEKGVQEINSSLKINLYSYFDLRIDFLPKGSDHTFISYSTPENQQVANTATSNPSFGNWTEVIYPADDWFVPFEKEIMSDYPFINKIDSQIGSFFQIDCFTKNMDKKQIDIVAARIEKYVQSDEVITVLRNARCTSVTIQFSPDEDKITLISYESSDFKPDGSDINSIKWYEFDNLN